MKKLLLETRWLGLLAVLGFAAVVAGLATKVVNQFVKENAPDVAAEARNFLPIALENGQLVEPADALIRKTYGDEDGSFDVVLNTQVDELGVEDLQTIGLYASRKAVYVVSKEKTELRSLDALPDFRFDEKTLDALLQWVEGKLGVALFVAVFIGAFLFMSVAILLYASLAHLLVGKHFGADYSRTLRITVWTYLVLTASSLYLPIGIIVKFVLVLLANFLIDKFAYPKAPAPEPPPIPAP